MAWTTHDRVLELRARHVAIDVVVDTLDGWRLNISGRNASVVAFYGFLSIFPLLLVATTILGFVLDGNQNLQQRIINGALGDIPVLGQQLENDPASLTGNWYALIIGLVGALWSSTKAFTGLQIGLDDIWEVHVDHRDAMPKQRGKALLGLLFISAAQIATITITSVVNAAGFPILGRIALLLANLVINVVVIAAMFRFLTAAQATWNDVWAGAVFSGTAFSLLQYFGTAIVDQIRDNASSTYGSFALVLGLITWLSLLAISSLMGAEFNAALVRYREGSLDRVRPAHNGSTVQRPASVTAT
jgi:membrane protein